MGKSIYKSFSASAFGDLSSPAETLHFLAGEAIFVQGRTADAMFRVEQGTVKLSVVSGEKKLAGLALLAAGDCFGEGCLIDEGRRTHTATAMNPTTVQRVDKAHLSSRLRKELPFAQLFVTYLLARIRQAEQSRADHLVDCSEKRLARLLLQLGGYGEPSLGRGSRRRSTPLNISQSALAEVVGTTRSRVSYFMNRFRKLGFIEYDPAIRVRSSLEQVILRN